MNDQLAIRISTRRADVLAATYTARELAKKLATHEEVLAAERRKATRYHRALVEIRSGRWRAEHAATLADDALTGNVRGVRPTHIIENEAGR